MNDGCRMTNDERTTNDGIRMNDRCRAATLGCIGRSAFVIPYGRVTVRSPVGLGLLLVGLTGCGNAESSKLAKHEAMTGKAATEATLPLATSSDIEGAIAAQKGKVVVVDIWAEY